MGDVFVSGVIFVGGLVFSQDLAHYTSFFGPTGVGRRYNRGQ
jgi:hypothetical protein